MDNNECFALKKEDLKEGEKKEIEIQQTKILVARVNDLVYAVGAVCPHYKAPLVKGALCGTKLYCPWHHSAFDITNGKLCEPPAIDELPVYEVIEKNGDIYVKLSAKEAATGERKMVVSEKTFVIIGGGAAGYMAAQTLRHQGFGGKLVMITREAELPYDRTALSKNFLSGKKKEEDLPLRKTEFFEKNNIELITGKEVVKADVIGRQIFFSDNSSLTYDSLLIASGSAPQRLTVEGADKKNVFTLRSEKDAKEILAKAKEAKHVCIIGASFIALEVAASLTTLGLQVTVIAKEKLPFEKKFGEAIGNMFLNMHKEKGVVIKTEAEVENVEGNDNAATIVLKDGERIETDMIVVGIGVTPKTDFIKGIVLHDKDNSVLVDEYLRAANACFVAGDITRYDDTRTNEQVRIEHWRLAQQHGRLAAMNMLGQKHSVKEIVPFFWTNQYDKRLSYVGHAEDWDDIVLEGNIDEQSFLSFYVKDKKVLAVASMNRDVESNQIEEMMLTNGLMSVDEIRQKLREAK